MLNGKMKSFIWDMIAVFSAILGVLGSMCAWESGEISFLRMMLQVIAFGAFTYASANTASCLRRAARMARRRAAHSRMVAVPARHLHAA